jgi:uncharacterized protein YndB with AHSA1/START domain
VTTPISPLAVRRSVWIAATPERVWREFESFERMRTWFGTGHALTAYEPRLGGLVETDASPHRGGEGLVFGGKIIVFEPAREITWENEWYGKGWTQPSLITIRLTPYLEGTIVELFHHRMEGAPAPGEMLNGFEGGWDTHHLEALRAVVEA